MFSFGDAHFYGSTGAMHLNQPIVGMAATPIGHGYWLVASDGGMFTFGDARFHGSTGGDAPEPADRRRWRATPSGRGYWLVASDGGMFSVRRRATSTARPAGSRLPRRSWPSRRPRAGHGYWLVGANGDVYAFGDAKYFGSAGGNQPVVAAVASPST